MISRRSDFEWSYFLRLQFPRSEAKSHTQTDIESHLNLALRGLEATQHQVHKLVTVVKDQSQQIERLISKDKEQSQQIERQSQQIERLISKDKEQSQQIERQSQQIKELSQQSKLIEQGLPTPSEWKIPNIKDVFLKAQFGTQILVSEPFYLSQRGYKYLLQIEVMSDIFLRLSIKVVPGEFDGLLPWPCKEKVRVTVNFLNKLKGTERNSSNVVFDFAESSEPWCRPLHDDHQEYRLVLKVGYSSLSLHDYALLIRVNRE